MKQSHILIILIKRNSRRRPMLEIGLYLHELAICVADSENRKYNWALAIVGYLS